VDGYQASSHVPLDVAIRLVPGVAPRTGTPAHRRTWTHNCGFFSVELDHLVKLIREWIADFFSTQATSERGTGPRKARPTMTAVSP
jgi:hypothetical protein